MAHEVEAMMYVGETPWHQIGTKLEGDPTVPEAMEAAGLNWKVGLRRLQTMEEVPQVVDHVATYRETDGKILGVVGPDFVPLQQADAFAFFQPILDAKLARLETAGSLRGGRRIFVLARVNSDPLEVVPGDPIEKYILLSHAHDGSLAIRAGFTPIRVVCANTLRMAVDSEASKLIRVKHTSGAKVTLEALRETMSLADAEFNATAEQYRFLASRKVNREDLARFVNVVFRPGQACRTTEDRKACEKRLMEKIEPIFQKGRGNNLPGAAGSWWAAYNAAVEYVQYERGNTVSRRLDSAWYGDGAKKNAAALSTALELATAA